MKVKITFFAEKIVSQSQKLEQDYIPQRTSKIAEKQCNLNHNYTDVLVVSMFSGKLCNSLPEVQKMCPKSPENYTYDQFQIFPVFNSNQLKKGLKGDPMLPNGHYYILFTTLYLRDE